MSCLHQEQGGDELWKNLEQVVAHLGAALPCHKDS